MSQSTFDRYTRHAIKFTQALSGMPAELQVVHGTLAGWLPVTLVRPVRNYGRNRWEVAPLGSDRTYIVDESRLRVPDFEYTRRRSDPTGTYPHAGDDAYMLDPST